MGQQVSLGSSDQVPDGTVTGFEAAGRPIAVARIEGTLFAFEDVCSHRQCTLSQGGELLGKSIECECHGSVFSLETGQVLNPPATDPIAVFPVSEEGGTIEVEV